MLEIVNTTIKKYNMLDTGEQVVVALSGGADSVSLVLVLKKLGFDVKAVHVNHHLRGEESDRDMKFCENFCKKLNVPLEVYHVDVKEKMREGGLSTETAARELRYEIFAKYENFAKVATAHTADDALETTLFNLTRGTGLKGICSIPATRGIIIRPLINTPRKDIEAFLLAGNQPFVTDSTNNETEYSRNKIRHNVLPQLLAVNENLVENYIRARENLEEDSNFLENLSEKAFVNAKLFGDKTYDIKKILELEKPVKRRVFARILAENGIEVSREKILELEKVSENGGKINPKGNTFFECKNGILRFFFVKNQFEAYGKVSLNIENFGDFELLGRKVTLKIDEDVNINRKFTNKCFDYDKIKGTLVLRNRLEGDKIRLVNRDFTSSVKKLFNSAFTADLRENRVLLSDDEGLVFVEDFGPAERVKIDDGTNKVLEVLID